MKIRLTKIMLIVVVTVVTFLSYEHPNQSYAATSLIDQVCGTWALQQATNSAQLTSYSSSISTAMSYTNIRGFSLRVPWSAVDGDLSLINQGKGYAGTHDFSVRFMAGRWTPARVINQGAYYYNFTDTLDNNIVKPVPKPFSDSGTPGNPVFEQNYEAMVVKLATWARSNNVRLIHLPWYGQNWAELNNGTEVRAAPGYSYSNWLIGHEKLIDIALRHAGSDLAFEFPLTGNGPLVTAIDDLTTYIVNTAGANNQKIFVQPNGWGPSGYGWGNGDWGAPDATQEAQKDAAVWHKAILRGEQAIQPSDYDWSMMYNILRSNNAMMSEVFVQSFQTNQAHHALLGTEISSFKTFACPSSQSSGSGGSGGGSNQGGGVGNPKTTEKKQTTTPVSGIPSNAKKASEIQQANLTKKMRDYHHISIILLFVLGIYSIAMIGGMLWFFRHSTFVLKLRSKLPFWKP